MMNEEEEVEESDVEEEEEEEDWQTCSEDEEERGGGGGTSSESLHNSSRLLQKDELLNVFKAVHTGPKCKEEQLTVGLVSGNYICKISIELLSHIKLLSSTFYLGPTGRVSQRGKKFHHQHDPKEQEGFCFSHTWTHQALSGACQSICCIKPVSTS